MGYTADEVLNQIEEEDVRFVRLAFRDAFGVQKNSAVMPGEVKKAFLYGIPINARAIAGFADSPYASLYLKPDPDTLTILPWRSESGKVLRMFCDVCTPVGEVYGCDTRYILKKAIEKAKEAGVEFRFSTESEFYLFLKDEDGNPIPKKKLYVRRFAAKCDECAFKILCNGCSNCGYCEGCKANT